jgi:hypothetical protein
MRSLLLAIPLLMNQCSGVDYWSEPPLPVWEQVYEDIRDLSVERHQRGQDIELRVAPGLSLDRVEQVTALYADGTGFWSGAFDFPQTVPLTIMGDDDQDWWKSITHPESPPLRGDYSLYDARWFENARSNRSIGMADIDHLGMPHIITVVGSEVDFEHLDAFSGSLLARHESTHWFQYIATGLTTEKCTDWKMALFLAYYDSVENDTNGMACPWLSTPCWLIEGHAELYTIPFGIDTKSAPLTGFGSGILRDLRIRQITHRTEDKLRDLLQLTRHDVMTGEANCSREVQYSIGLLVNEKLFYDFGDEKINKFWLAINQPSSAASPSWEIAFDEVFGISAERWYETSAIPYLLGVFDDDVA